MAFGEGMAMRRRTTPPGLRRFGKATKAIIAIAAALGTFVARGDVILDRSPAAFPSATTVPSDYSSWSNTREGQHFADSFYFDQRAKVTGMDIYSRIAYMAENVEVGVLANIQVWTDNAGIPGALFTEFTDVIDVIDTEGAGGGTFLLNRLHVDFQNALHLEGGVTYWISMSGAYQDIGLIGLGGIDGGTGFPQDGKRAHFSDDTLINVLFWWDNAFRLDGDLRPIPEPSSLALVGLALTLAIRVSRAGRPRDGACERQAS